MKKMKGTVSQYAVYEDPKTNFKHQSLLQDYEELEKETENTKNKLEMMKQKKMILMAEVRFLKRRHEYLMKNQLSNDRFNGDLVQQKKVSNQSSGKKNEKNRVRKRPAAALQPIPTISGVNQQERIYGGFDVSLQNSNPAPSLDLNQKVKYSRKKTNLQNAAPNIDLNLKDRVFNGRDAGERNATPFFDLNLISTEEEEMQAHCEPLRVEELKKSLLRSGNDEQQNDIKISACRNIGDGPSRAGKRKITWQDQVALKV